METDAAIELMPLVGGTLVFDFLNTGGGSLDAPDDELLHDYGDLIAWSRHAGDWTQPAPTGSCSRQWIAALRPGRSTRVLSRSADTSTSCSVRSQRVARRRRGA